MTLQSSGAISLSDIRNKFDYILYYEDKSISNKCDYDLNSPYNFSGNGNIDKYNELKNILIDCSIPISFKEIKFYKSNFKRKTFVNKRLILASLK